jgi:hypothetical protein
MEEIDILRAAEEMVKLHRHRAEEAAGARSSKMASQGDVKGFNVWKRVVDAIRDLGRGKPELDEYF